MWEQDLSSRFLFFCFFFSLLNEKKLSNSFKKKFQDQSNEQPKENKKLRINWIGRYSAYTSEPPNNICEDSNKSFDIFSLSEIGSCSARIRMISQCKSTLPRTPDYYSKKEEWDRAQQESFSNSSVVVIAQCWDGLSSQNPIGWPHGLGLKLKGISNCLGCPFV